MKEKYQVNWNKTHFRMVNDEKEQILELLMSPSDDSYNLGKTLFKYNCESLKSLLKAWGLKSWRKYPKKNGLTKHSLIFENHKIHITKVFDNHESYCKKTSVANKVKKKTPRFDITIQERVVKGDSSFWVYMVIDYNKVFTSFRQLIIYIGNQLKKQNN